MRRFGAVTGCLVANTTASVISHAPVTISRPRKQRVDMQMRTHQREMQNTHLSSHKMNRSGPLLPVALLRDVSASLHCCVTRCEEQRCDVRGRGARRHEVRRIYCYYSGLMRSNRYITDFSSPNAPITLGIFQFDCY